jgi:hypothetical protein
MVANSTFRGTRVPQAANFFMQSVRGKYRFMTSLKRCARCGRLKGVPKKKTNFSGPKKKKHRMVFFPGRNISGVILG